MNTQQECLDYLDWDWKGTARGPIKQVENLCSQGGFFEVPHLLLSYVDYLSGLSSGSGPSHGNGDAVDYFKRFFPANYSDPSYLLVYSYRNGLVHQFTPKLVQLTNGDVIGWQMGLGELRNVHLRVMPQGSNLFSLYVDGCQFLDDFRLSVDNLKKEILNNPVTHAAFIQGYNAYNQPVNIGQVSNWFDKTSITRLFAGLTNGNIP